MNDLRISLAHHGDTFKLCDMIRTAGEADIARGYPPAWLSSADASVRVAIDAQRMRIVTAGVEVVGCFSIDEMDNLVWGAQPDSATYLHCLTVRADVQGQGFGRRIVQYVERHAATQGHSLVRLDVPIERQITRNWYKSLGYIEHGTVKPPTYSRATMLYQKSTSPVGE